MEHILVYGEANKLRLTGKHETSSITRFDYHEGNRGASIRIPVKKRYFIIVLFISFLKGRNHERRKRILRRQKTKFKH
jgi:hypothetical protein